MATVSDIPLTEEQEKLLKELEDEFKDRYTENDQEFMTVMNHRPSPPPTIPNWQEFKQNNRYESNRQDTWRYDRRRDDHNDRWRDNRHDRWRDRNDRRRDDRHNTHYHPYPPRSQRHYNLY